MKKSTYFKNVLLITLLLIFVLNAKTFSQFANPVKAKNGMVVSACSLASEVGIDIMKKGGNAIDASVAVGFALAVTYQYAGNIGGGGFMVLHFPDGKSTTIDFREKAPKSAYKDMYLDEKGNLIPELSQKGIKSVGVPGSVAGLIYALEKYGTMKLSEVIQPAIDLAKKGFILNEAQANSFERYLKRFEKYPSTIKAFTKNGIPYNEGELFIQNDLANTLSLIKKNGRDGFYKGKVADLFIKQVNEMNGYITHSDLENYKPVERKPVKGTYKDYEIISMGPPSSGGIAIIQLLNILENFNFNKTEWNSSNYINKLVEAMKYVYADRAEHLGDEDFYPVPKEKLLSKKYAKKIYNRIKNKAVPSDEIKSQLPNDYYESNETTHYSVYDKYGNAVSVTTTVNSGYGSKVVVEGAGFILNNEMDDFVSKAGEPNQFGLVGGKANSIQPEKRMLSSMTPTIVLKNGKPFLIVGSPGGSTIITTVLQVILNVIEFDMNIKEAVSAPRIHHQWLPDKIFIEKFAVNSDTIIKLEEMGYNFSDRNSMFTILGSAQSILIDNNKNEIYGASDSRSNGRAIGY
ncbi:MAG: gamma-glutamyltransferase [Ignavibacteriae bacterium]|nr:MAG: gamma-glutamyltransferase [Ignavibacteriota bacterium]